MWGGDGGDDDGVSGGRAWWGGVGRARGWGGAAGRTALLGRVRADVRVEVGGKTPLQERKVGVLSDVYVRFLRWAFEGLRRAPSGGVLGLVTNASFLDGPVHRGMRAAMGRWSEAIEVFDFGGSALTARDTKVDDNVFGVRPAGVPDTHLTLPQSLRQLVRRVWRGGGV